MSLQPALSRRIYLEVLDVSKHLDDYHVLWSDPKNLIWSTQSPKTTLAASRAWMLQWTNPPNASIDNYAIMLPTWPSIPPSPSNPSPPQQKATLIGVVGVIRTSPHELGYMLRHEYWNQGFASEAVTMFLALYWAMESRKDVQALIAKVDSENVTSARIVRKMGFEVLEVREREVELPGRGWRDMILWRLERPEGGDGDGG
ncbi:hypothetical protein MMC30_002177 [Trapelia coarctata]|nr:hypothetical protein [Trapelia coarctata]